MDNQPATRCFLIFTAPGVGVSYFSRIFVRPQFRGQGIGKGLLRSVARIAQQKSCSGMRWEVLGWNESAIELYRSLGAEFLEDWRLFLLKDEALEHLAEETPGS